MRPPTGAVILKKGFFCVLTPRSNIHFVMHPARSGCYRNSGLVGNVAQVKAAPEYKEGRPLVVIGTTESLPPSYPASK